jgi:hypothetical protein
MELRNNLTSIRQTVQELLDKGSYMSEATDLVTLIRRCAAEVAEASALGLMIGVFNDVPPRDPQWLKSYSAVTSEHSSDVPTAQNSRLS